MSYYLPSDVTESEISDYYQNKNHDLECKLDLLLEELKEVEEQIALNERHHDLLSDKKADVLSEIYEVEQEML